MREKNLFEAAKRKDLEVVQALIAAGADVNHANADTDGYTPLFVAARSGSTETVQALIAAGADVNYVDRDRHTPLLSAVGYGSTETVKVLIAAGADVNHADMFGFTPLFVAARSGSTETVKALIAAGADVKPLLSNQLKVSSNDMLLILRNAGHAKSIAEHLRTIDDVSKVNDLSFRTYDGTAIRIKDGMLLESSYFFFTKSTPLSEIFKEDYAVAHLQRGAPIKEDVLLAFVNTMPERPAAMYALLPVLQNKNTKLSELPKDVLGMVGEFVAGRELHAKSPAQRSFSAAEAARSPEASKGKGRSNQR
jgi:hypothetical protein